MDGRNKASGLFVGTPLGKSLINDHNPQDDDLGAITNRRARFNKQQTVRDEQGRRRFHGAFTGGFSAGYFNSVSTAQGFQPKSFVSRRADKKPDHCSNTLYNQRPEDFMDEEDLSEFGIAPKKIRMLGDYQATPSGLPGSHLDDTSYNRLLKPATQSIGEKILRRMSGNLSHKLLRTTLDDISKVIKNDYHGLGYKPLKVQFLSKEKTFRNPLHALLGGGKRLEISGEAFGSGVLDDDEDHVGHADEYGYDDIANYEFNSKAKSQPRADLKSSDVYCHQNKWDKDQLWIEGFILVRDSDAMKQCDDNYDRYPLPSIESDWQMPTRSVPYLVSQTSQTIAQQELNWQRAQQSTSSFNKKFAKGTTGLITSDKFEEKSGLLSYSDIKAADEAAKIPEPATSSSSLADSRPKATISRKTIEWRPCSLLCKHFNVPNPYPDNVYFGSKISSLTSDSNNDPIKIDQIGDSIVTEASKNAPIELRRAIFNIRFNDDDDDEGSPQKTQNDDILSDECTDSENEPQILEHSDVEACVVLEKTESLEENDQRDINKAGDDSDEILIVSVEKPEPEVIVLSSSSSSSHSSRSSCSSTSSPSSTNRVKRRETVPICDINQESDEDAYGPPLPPAQQALIGLNSNRSISHSGSALSGRKRKKKKNKRKKSGSREKSVRAGKSAQ